MFPKPSEFITCIRLVKSLWKVFGKQRENLKNDWRNRLCLKHFCLVLLYIYPSEYGLSLPNDLRGNIRHGSLLGRLTEVLPKPVMGKALPTQKGL